MRHLARTPARFALACVCALVAVACNPMLDQPTGQVAPTSFQTHQYTYHGPTAWIAVRIDQDTGFTGDLTALAKAYTGATGATTCVGDGVDGADVTERCGASCSLVSPSRVVWAADGSRGYRRLFLAREGMPFRVVVSGEASTVAPDLAALDDDGGLVGSASFHDDSVPYEPVPWDILC